MKGWHQTLDYIQQVSNQKWFHSAKLNELYVFNEGLFGTHRKSLHDQMSYHHSSIFKVLHSNAKVVDVEQTEECIMIATLVTGRSDPHGHK